MANDLIGRIRDGEFFVSEFPRLVDVKTQYRVRWSTARAALDLMHQVGWVMARWWGPRQFMALADPLPSKAAQNAGSEIVAAPADQVSTVVADGRWASASQDSVSQPQPRSTTAAILVALTAHARPVTLAQLCQSAMLNVVTAEARLRQLVQYRWVRRFDDVGEPAYTLDTEGCDVAKTMTKQLMCPPARTVH